MPSPETPDKELVVERAPNVRTLTPTGSRLRKFPQLAGFVLLVAMGIGVPAAPSGGDLGKVFWVLSLIVGALAGCAIATWAEQRMYRGLVGVSGLKRLALTVFTPMVFTVVWPLLLMVGGFALILDDGVLLGGIFFGGAWFLSASMGTIVIVGLDVLISALIPDFRSRIQAAVLGLLVVAVGVTFAVYRIGLAAGEELRRQAMEGNLGEGLSIDIGSDEKIEGQDAVNLLASAETEQFIAMAFVFFAAVLGLPAIVSACGKLADAVMERLNPLAEAMECVGEGDLDVRVEVGGSQDLVQITQGFNDMTSSLKTTLVDLEATNRATSRFVPFQFLDLLDKASIRDIERGDQTRLDMSIMFCDIRGFTTMAERMGPQATFAFINRYLAHMEAEIHREHGFINDFAGDGIMALFHTGADAAVRAGLGMQAALARFNAALRDEGMDPIRVGIGVNSGTLMLGTIGGRDRLACTVIGDPANTAARVEGMTKLYGAVLLITDQTHERLDDTTRYQIREVDRVQAKGKTEPVVIYEVLDGLDAEERDHKLGNRSAFEAGLVAYRRGAFENAKDHFVVCTEAAPDDGAARLYVERCERIIRRGPPTGWNGVTRLDTK